MLSSEFAAAKINLTLEVLGRRPDGYHEIRSLVAFAQDVGDRLSLGSGRYTATEMVGPYAEGIAGGNLVDKAVAGIVAAAPGILTNPDLGRVTLEKNLPVASGIGGGSADAAAALRLLRSAFPQIAALDFAGLARRLGADVPVCLRSRASLMTGIGEEIADVTLPGELFAVLVNPLISVPANKTAQVFAALAAPALAGDAVKDATPTFFCTSDVIRYAQARGNALEAPARKLFPAIDEVLGELARLADCRRAQLSGAGPTCFALFETKDAAEAGERRLVNRNPDWWIRSTRLV
jgi:4-diphosphocytidyl-2-C-methyl-D-erythritol kinase